MRRCLTDLELFKSSDALIAKCNGLKPFESMAFTSEFQANRYATDDSALYSY
jgi:hypothetical protein